MIGKTEKVINTKVTEWAEQRLIAICSKHHITLYNFLQMMCETIIRYMDDKTNLTPEMERAMSIFEHLEGWENCYNLAQSVVEPVGTKTLDEFTGNTDDRLRIAAQKLREGYIIDLKNLGKIYPRDLNVQDAIYFLADEEHKGERAVMVEKPTFFGQWGQTVNVQKIFESVVCKMFPERYKKLRLLANQWGCNSQLDVLDRLLDNELQGMDNAAIREEFEDCDRSDYGTKPTDHRYKRKHHKSVDTIKFDKKDVPDLPELFPEDDLPSNPRDNEPKDFRPFGCEW